jgi:hypothetical protein
MSKGEPSSFHEALDVEKWKQSIEWAKGINSHWATHYELNLIRALMEREAARPWQFNREGQWRLVLREMMKGNVKR